MITLFIYFSTEKARTNYRIGMVRINLSKMELYEQMERIAQNLIEMEIE